MKSFLTPLSLSRIGFAGCFLVGCILVGCGDSPEAESKPGPSESQLAEQLAEATRRQEESARSLDEAARKLKEALAATEKYRTPDPDALVEFVPPPDRIDAFEKSFGFGNQDEVAHFWNWNHTWTFTDERARNDKWENYTHLTFAYKLVGDFEVKLKGYMSRSYTNSKRPHLHIAGQEIKLINKTGKANFEINIERVSNKLYYTVFPNTPEIVELTPDQAGPTELLLRFHNRHATVQYCSIKADTIDRSSP